MEFECQLLHGLITHLRRDRALARKNFNILTLHRLDIHYDVFRQLFRVADTVERMSPVDSSTDFGNWKKKKKQKP